MSRAELETIVNVVERGRGLATGTLQEPSQPLNYRGHIRGLDVLRGTAVFVVLLDHGYGNAVPYERWHGLAAAWIALTGMGHLGVHLFFVLSGFLITGILLDGKDRPHAARTFYGRRMQRILPAYLLLLVIIWVTHLVDWKFILASLLFVVNLGGLIGVKLWHYSYVWSLAVEEQFYLVWPQILWRCSRKTAWRTIVLCLVLAPIFRLAMALIGQDTYFKTWLNVDYLMYGAVIAYTLRTGALHAGNIRRVTRLLYAAGWAGILLSVAVWIVARDTRWAPVLFDAIGRTPEMVLFVALVLSAILAHQESLPASADRRAKRQAGIIDRLTAQLRHLPAQAMIFLGYISYGLYLVHMVVFRMYDRLVAGTALAAIDTSFAVLSLRAVICSAIAILLAWLSRSTLEAWFLRRKPGAADAAVTRPIVPVLAHPPAE